MGLAQELLAQAHHLVTYEGPNPSGASLRRAVSAAYYALFHLLVEDASQRWQGSAEARIAIQRAFNHGPMKAVSLRFRPSKQPVWVDWLGNKQPIPLELQNVADAFVDLQEKRHAADYDQAAPWNPADVLDLVRLAQSAFDDWHSIRTHPLAGNYLLAMLLANRRA